MALLAASGVARRPWFEDRDLELGEGEVVVLSGPTGSGKTLFLRVLADLDPCDAGRVALEGVPQSAMAAREWRRQVLYVHPSPPLFEGTVSANLERVTALAAHGGRTPLEVPGLDPDAAAATLSSGEAQLLVLYRALGTDPRVLLLDETLASLDPERRSAVERELAGWVRAGPRAVLLVSHDPAQAARLGARVESFP